MQTVSHFSSIFFGATLNALHFPSFRPSSCLFMYIFCPPPGHTHKHTLTVPSFSLTRKQIVALTFTASEMRKLFVAGGSYVFIARAQHAAQPKGHKLTFYKCLRPPSLSCVDFSNDRQQRGGSNEGNEERTRGEQTCIFILFYIYCQATLGYTAIHVKCELLSFRTL